MAPEKQATAEDILKDHSAPVREIAAALREIILETLDGMVEKAYPGWHGIGFRHPRAGYICGIFPREGSVRLLFEKGILLSDPHGLLEGEGKQTRYLEIDSVEGVPREGLQLLLLEAASL